jgi:hypothetical protein
MIQGANQPMMQSQTKLQWAPRKRLGLTEGKQFAEWVVFPMILLIYPLRHILVGAEWWDTGYNYGNFVYMDQMDPMWFFSTYLATTLGNAFSCISETMLGLNVLTGLLVSVLALLGYYFFWRRLEIPVWLVFLGEMLALSLCWCPTALLYNYLTYLFFAVSVVCLYGGLTTHRSWLSMPLLLMAGFFLGGNMFVRFSNLPQMALILAVWVYEILQHHKWKEILRKTLICLAGYLLGAGIVLINIHRAYGIDLYVQSITRLLEMPQEASSYTPMAMIIGPIHNYRQNLNWLILPGILTAIATFIFTLCPAKLRKWGILPYGAIILASFYYLMQQNMFDFVYTDKTSVFQWGVTFLILTFLVCLIQIFRPGVTPKDKLMPGLCVLILLITPLGTNNHLYTVINNLFMVAPYTLWMLYRFLRFSLNKQVGRFTISLLAAKITLICILLMIFVQSAIFGWVYVFSEAGGGENLHTKIENNAILKGIYTSPDRAAIIGSLSEYVTAHNLTGREIILYGQIPAMSYYLEMPFAITSWPDLQSYGLNVMTADLEKLEAAIAEGSRQLPAVLLEIRYGAYISDGAAALRAMNLTDDEIERVEADPKFALIQIWLEKFEYHPVFKNDKFVLFTTDYDQGTEIAYISVR